MKSSSIRILDVVKTLDPTKAMELLNQFIVEEIKTLDEAVPVEVITQILDVMVRLDSALAKDAMTELLKEYPQPCGYRETIEKVKEEIKI